MLSYAETWQIENGNPQLTQMLSWRLLERLA